MTLTDFKNHTKRTSILFVLVLYGLTAFFIGTNFKNTERISDDSQIENPVSKIDKPQPHLDVQSAKVLPAQVKLCSNTYFGFEITYPSDWFTTYNNKEEECTFFAPYSFIVPESKEGDVTPIRVEIVTLNDWEETVKFWENPNDFNNVLSARNIDMTGVAVKKIEISSTGAGNVKRGFVKNAYLIFDSENPMIFTYQQQEENEDVENNIRVLEEMVGSLKLL